MGTFAWWAWFFGNDRLERLSHVLFGYTVNVHTDSYSNFSINGQILASYCICIDSELIHHLAFVLTKTITGVYQPSPAAAIVGGHAVSLIGWGTDNGIPYWIIQVSMNLL